MRSTSRSTCSNSLFVHILFWQASRNNNISLSFLAYVTAAATPKFKKEKKRNDILLPIFSNGNEEKSAVKIGMISTYGTWNIRVFVLKTILIFLSFSLGLAWDTGRRRQSREAFINPASQSVNNDRSAALEDVSCLERSSSYTLIFFFPTHDW